MKPPGRRRIRSGVNEAAVAFRKLGHLRATGAVPVLLDHLDFNPYGKSLIVAGAFVFRATHPTAHALGEIGMPALGPLVERVAAGDKKATKWGAIIVRRVLGRELGKVYLKQKAAAEPNRERAAQIEKLIPAIDAVAWMFLWDLPGEPKPEEQPKSTRAWQRASRS